MKHIFYYANEDDQQTRDAETGCAEARHGESVPWRTGEDWCSPKAGCLEGAADARG